MSTFSGHITQKIGGGGNFAITATNAAILTATANQYLKIKLIAHTINSELTIFVGGVKVAFVADGGPGVRNNLTAPNYTAAVNNSSIQMYEIIVPPNMTLSATLTGSGEITGTYLIIENTP